MKDFKLVIPSEKYKEQILEYVEEFKLNNESNIYGCGVMSKVNKSNFNGWLQDRLDIMNGKTKNGYIPETIYLLIRNLDEKIIATAVLRHKLNDYLLKYGGHFGYAVCPSERSKGYGTLILKLVLDEARKLNLNEIQISARKDNIASNKAILKNNGILVDEIYNPLKKELKCNYIVKL